MQNSTFKPGNRDDTAMLGWYLSACDDIMDMCPSSLYRVK